MEYEPYITNGRAGFRCIAKDGSKSYIYLNPSTTDNEEDTDVFLYRGETGDPHLDESVFFTWPTNTPGGP